MSEGRGWLAKEHKKRHQSHKMIYVVGVVGLFLVSAMGVSAYNSHTSKQLSVTRLTNTSAGASTSNKNILSIGGASSIPTSSNSKPVSSKPQSAAKKSSPTTAPNSQPPSAVSGPSAPTQPTNCSAKDSSYLASYKAWASGAFNDLSTQENISILGAATLGPVNVLSQINANINSINSQSTQNYGTYVSEDGQYQCHVTLKAPFYVPICTNLLACVPQIPLL